MNNITIPYSPHRFQKEIHENGKLKRFALVVAHRRFGKTVAAINRLIKSALTCNLMRPRCGYIAPYRHQGKAIAWDYLKHFASPIPGIRINESELFVEFPNGGRVTIYGADNPEAMRGLYFDDVVLDEIGSMRPEVWPEIIRPSLTDRKGKALFIGTPRGINHFYELYQSALKDSENWFVELYDVRRTQRISDEELDLARKTMSDNQFRQEFLCDFTASCDNTLIPLDLVSTAAARSIHFSTIERMPKVMGVDVARFGDAKTVIAMRQGTVVYPLIKMRGADTLDVAGRIAQEIKKFEPDGVFIDGGFNPGVISTLKGWGYKVTEIQFGAAATDAVHYANKRVEMWATLAQELSLCSIPDDLELKSDLVSPTYKFRPNGQMILESKEDMRDRGLPSPDCGDAVALLWAQPVASAAQKRKLQAIGGNYDAQGQEWSPFE